MNSESKLNDVAKLNTIKDNLLAKSKQESERPFPNDNRLGDYLENLEIIYSILDRLVGEK